MPQPPRRPAKSAKPAPSTLDQTARLLGAVFGQVTEETTSLQAVFRALAQPERRVVVELPWYADGGLHQIILKAREGTRVVFYNPLGHGGKAPGAVLPNGLKRRVEADGCESCELADLEAQFRAGKARALIT